MVYRIQEHAYAERRNDTIYGDNAAVYYQGIAQRTDIKLGKNFSDNVGRNGRHRGSRQIPPDIGTVQILSGRPQNIQRPYVAAAAFDIIAQLCI